MMFGTRDEFTYVECAACGCLHLENPPSEWTRYYPPEYYAHLPAQRESAYRRWLWRLQGTALVQRVSAPRFLAWVRQADVSRDARVLDVGCGRGHWLRRLRAAGWTQLTGIDPLIPRDVTWPDGVTLYQRTLDEHEGSYDFIMSHHAFEHMSDPAGAMSHFARLLAPAGKLLIRIPVADSEAWRTYRADWAQLDAPRHHFLHTRRSMECLAARSGFRIDTVTYDSNGFQFWGSEQYRRDIACIDAIHSGARADGCLAPRRDRLRYERRARALNATSGADSACFYLTLDTA